MQGVQSGSRII